MIDPLDAPGTQPRLDHAAQVEHPPVGHPLHVGEGLQDLLSDLEPLRRRLLDALLLQAA